MLTEQYKLPIFYVIIWVVGVVLNLFRRVEWLGIIMMFIVQIASLPVVIEQVSNIRVDNGNSNAYILFFMYILVFALMLSIVTGIFIAHIYSRLWNVFYIHGQRANFNTQLRDKWTTVTSLWFIEIFIIHVQLYFTDNLWKQSELRKYIFIFNSIAAAVITSLSTTWSYQLYNRRYAIRPARVDTTQSANTRAAHSTDDLLTGDGITSISQLSNHYF